MSEVLGIDFGTSTVFLTTDSSKGALDLTQGRAYLPSVAAWNGESLLIGDKAEAFLSSNPEAHEAMIYSVKSRITNGEESLTVSFAGKSKTFAVKDVVQAILHDVYVRASSMSSLKGLDIAKCPTRLGCPASWDGARRELLVEAAKAAGFKTVSIVDVREEPVAAALGWFDQVFLEGNGILKKRVLVFDMGGGTLDIADLSVERTSEDYKVNVYASDSSLNAGDALDRKISVWLANEFSRLTPGGVTLSGQKDPLTLEELARVLRPYGRLAKEDLSIQESTTVKLPVGLGISGEVKVSRSDLENLFKEGVSHAIALAERVRGEALLGDMLPKGGVTHSASDIRSLRTPSKDGLLADVDVVLLAGGMTRIPMVKNEITKRFPKSTEIVTMGIGDFDPLVQQSVVNGLATTVEPESLNAARPPMDIVLTWQDAMGNDQSVTLFSAYDSMFDNAWTHDFDFGYEVRTDVKKHPKLTSAKIHFLRKDGVPVSFKSIGVYYDNGKPTGEEKLLAEGDYLDVKLNGSSPLVFKFYVNRNLLIRDSTGHELKGSFDRFPGYQSRALANVRKRKSSESDFTFTVQIHKAEKFNTIQQAFYNTFNFS